MAVVPNELLMDFLDRMNPQDNRMDNWLVHDLIELRCICDAELQRRADEEPQSVMDPYTDPDIRMLIEEYEAELNPLPYDEEFNYDEG